MGLAEKRALKEFQEKVLPSYEEKIRSLAGDELELSIQWDCIAVEGQAHLYEECLPKIFFEPLLQALESIASDDMGKEALKEGLKRVVITNSNSFHNPRGFEFSEGVLKLDHRPTVNAAHQVDFDQRTKSITEKIENGL